MSKIQEIHNSTLFGITIEAGCSATIASTLMNVAGSSKTIYRAEQPYNKDYQESLYGSFKRSVSKEWIQKVLEVEESKYGDKVNFILASSWQLIDPVDPLVYAHGWFGLYDIQRNVKHYLHFTFRRDFYYLTGEYRKNVHQEDRKDILDRIGKLGVNVLHTAISGNIEEITANKDVILDMAYINDDVNYHLLINTLEKANGDYFLVFDKGDVIRIEDLMRKSNEFIIQKGSFNPLHHGHIKMMNETLSKHPDATPAFLISTFRYDKPHINYDELKDRIELMNKAGYPLIICKSVLFYETFSLLRKWSHQKSFYFPIGIDTLNRIYQTDKDNVSNDSTLKILNKDLDFSIKFFIYQKVDAFENNFKFSLFERSGYQRAPETKSYDKLIEIIEHEDDGISSTKIRNGEMENKLKL